MKTIRIDGIEYEEGSPAAHAAQVRLDALRNEQFAKDHPERIEMNKEVISKSPALDRIRQDANATSLLARDLVFVSAEVERKVYQASRCMEFVRPNTSYPRGAESYARRMVDEKGEAKVSATLAGDTPRVDVNVTEGLLPFRNVKAAYGYSVDDLERAAFSRVPLEQWKRDACVSAIARKIDRLGRSGTALDPDGVSGLTGFFNNAFVTLQTLTNGEWLTATAAEILADLQEMEAATIAAAGDTQPDSYRLILPTPYEGRLRTLRVGDSMSDLSVAEYFLRNARLTKSIQRWIALDAPTPTAGGIVGDIAATEALQGVFTPMDQSVSGVEWPMVISYEEMPPEMEGFEWLVSARARVGGVEFRKPYLSRYLQNID